MYNGRRGTTLRVQGGVRYSDDVGRYLCNHENGFANVLHNSFTAFSLTKLYVFRAFESFTPTTFRGRTTNTTTLYNVARKWVQVLDEFSSSKTLETFIK